LNNLAFVYAHRGQWDDSIQVFERVVTLTPQHSVAHFNLSFAYAVTRRYKDAIREQRAAIELDPGGPRIDEWRAREKQLEALAEGRDA
jgi:tetratricopeptide (TPR) repeat protein